MAALTAASWTVVRTEMLRRGKKKLFVGTLALAGTDTYPTGGVPLPTFEKFGFIRQVDDVRFIGQAAATTQYKVDYDKTNHKALMYEEEAAAAGGPLLECDVAEVPGPRTFFVEATGW